MRKEVTLLSRLKKKQQNNLLKEKVGMQEMQESNQLLS